MANPDDKTTKRDWMYKNAPLYVYDKPVENTADKVGSYGIWFNEVKDYPSDLRAAITGTGTSENTYVNEAKVDGQSIKQTQEITKDVKLNHNEQMFMWWQSMLDLAVLGGLRDVDIKRITDAKKREILKSEGKNTQTNRALYRQLRPKHTIPNS